VGLLTQAQIAQRWAVQKRFEPAMGQEERARLYSGWKKAVERAKSWVDA
jgi:glycerol kinase